MNLDKVRHVSSAGYRLPDRPNAPSSRRRPSAKKPQDKTQRTERLDDPPQRSDDCDPVKDDQAWRDCVRTEIRGYKEWEKNWSFLKNYDQLGQPKAERVLPSYIPLFCDRLPNTSNHTFGSRLATPLGMELVRVDRMLMWTGRHHKSKPDPEMMPC